MRTGSVALALPLLALLGVVVALATGDPVVAAFAAALAVGLSGVFLYTAVADRVRWKLPGPPDVEGDPLTLLERSFHEGEYGRRAILSRLAGLDWQVPVDPAARLREETEILTAPEAEFLDYLDRRLTEVERRT